MEFDHIEASQGFDSSAQSINKLLKGSNHKKFPEDSAGEDVQACIVESNKSGITEDERAVLEREPDSTSHYDDSIRKSEQNDVVVASISCGVEGDEKVLKNCDNELPLIECEVNVEIGGPGSQMMSRDAIDMDVDTGGPLTTEELPCHRLENLQSVSANENTFEHERSTIGNASTKIDSVDVPSVLELRESSGYSQVNRKEFQQNFDDQLSQLSDKGEVQTADSEAANALETVHREEEGVTAESDYRKDESVDTECRNESSFHTEYRKDETETECRKEARLREECRKKECAVTECGKDKCFEAENSKDENSEVECSNNESVENECRNSASFEAESRNDRNAEIECSKEVHFEVECSNNESVENECRNSAIFEAESRNDRNAEIECSKEVHFEVECRKNESVENECRNSASFEAESRNDRNDEIECSKEVHFEVECRKNESVENECRNSASFEAESRNDRNDEIECSKEVHFEVECRKNESVENECRNSASFEAESRNDRNAEIECSKEVHFEVECRKNESVENECRNSASFEAESRNDRNAEVQCNKEVHFEVECSNNESVENEDREGVTFKAKRTEDESSDVVAKRRKEETAGVTLDTDNSLTSLPLEEFVVIDVYEGESLAREIRPKIEKKKTTRRRPSFFHRMLRRRKARNKASECLCDRKAGERITDEKIEDERTAGERIAEERIEDERIAEERIEGERIAEEWIEDERIAEEWIEDKRIAEERIEGERIAEEWIEDERIAEERIAEESTTGLSTQVKSVDQGSHSQESFLSLNVFMKEMVESVRRELQLTFYGQESESERQIANEMESNNTSNGLLEQKDSNKYTDAKTELDRSLELEDVENRDLIEGDGHGSHCIAQSQSSSKVVGPCEVEAKIELQNRISTVSFGSSGCPDQTSNVLDQSRGDVRARSSTPAQNTSIEKKNSQRGHHCSREANGESVSFSDGDLVGSPEIHVQAGKSKEADDAENGSAPADVSHDLVSRSFVFRPSDGFIVKKRNFAKRSASNASHGSSHEASPLPTVEASSSKVSSKKDDQVTSHGQSETGVSAAQKKVDKDKEKPHNNDLVKASFLYLAGMKRKKRQPFDLSIFSRFHPKTS
eukprot:gene1889-16387_t